MKPGDIIALDATVSEVRPDGIAVLTIPSAGLLPAVVLIRVDNPPPPAEGMSLEDASFAASARAARAIDAEPPTPAPGADVVETATGRRGVVVNGEGLYVGAKWAKVPDRLAVLWEDRQGPLWADPRDLSPA